MGKLRDFLDADWARLSTLAVGLPNKRQMWHSLSPRFAPVTLVRLAQCFHLAGSFRWAKFPALVNFVLFGIEVPPRLHIGPGLVLMHTQGTVLGAASIGENVTIYHQVTIGAVGMDFAYTQALRPIVGNNVVIGAGAKVLGSLVLGHGSVIAANAVVLSDVPSNYVAVGVPAKNLPPKSERPKSSQEVGVA